MPVAIAGVAVAGAGMLFSGLQGRKAQKEAMREAKRQRALAQEQLNFAKEQWNYYQETYGDITNLMVADAMQTEVGDYQGVADRAAVDIADRFGAQRDAGDRQLFAYGLDPSSGRYVSQNRSLDAQEALSSTLAQNQARRSEQQRADMLNQNKRQAIGMFGQQQMNRGENLYGQAMQNMQNVAAGNFQYQAGLANNLFANAGQFAGMGLGTALNQWGKQPQQQPQQQPMQGMNTKAGYTSGGAPLIDFGGVQSSYDNSYGNPYSNPYGNTFRNA